MVYQTRNNSRGYADPVKPTAMCNDIRHSAPPDNSFTKLFNPVHEAILGAFAQKGERVRERQTERDKNLGKANNHDINELCKNRE